MGRDRGRPLYEHGHRELLAAADLGLQTFAIKTYTVFAPKARFLVLLYSSQNGDLLAMIEAVEPGGIAIVRAPAGVGGTRFLEEIAVRAARSLRIEPVGCGAEPLGALRVALHAADGTPIMLTDSREAAVANAWSNELQAVSVH